MERFSQHFSVGLSQPELDFVDILPNEDLPVYVDPFAISLYEDEFSRSCSDTIIAFFQAAISSISSGDKRRAERMLVHLSEPNETRLGVSTGSPRGRGVGDKQAKDLYESIAASQAVQSGLISDISECDLFISGIGPDKISDMTTNIIRRKLIEYTQRQCQLHNAPMIKAPSGLQWDDTRGMWREEYQYLPTYKHEKLLLVPKIFVRRHLSLSSQEYLNKYVLEYLRAEHLAAHSGLVEVLKNGAHRVTKKALKAYYPCTKEWMAGFSEKHPDVLKNYRMVAERLAKLERQAEANFLNGEYDEKLFAQALIQKLSEIPAGNEAATQFHHLVVGIIEFLFWPFLTNPEKEREINEGRKRIDIMYNNAADTGFFNKVLIAPQTAAIRIPIECKNYSKDPQNPEIDQIAGRFAPNRGWLGMLVYRTTTDYSLLLKRCRDTALEKRGFILPLGDRQITDMLSDVAEGKRANIETRLNNLFNRIIC